MRNDIRILRRRIDDLFETLAPRRNGGSAGAPMMVCTVSQSPGVVPGTFLVTPGWITGGQAGITSYTDGRTEFVTVLGPQVPGHGAVLIADLAPGGRWVAEYGHRPRCSTTISVSDCIQAVQGQEVQQVTLSGSPTGGTFTLTISTGTTAPIAYNAAAADIQSALEALSFVGAGNVTVAGGPFPDSPVTVTFTSAVYLHFAPSPIPLIKGDVPGLTGAAGAKFTITSASLPGNVPDGATYQLTSHAVWNLVMYGAPTGGTYTITQSGNTTEAIAYNASATDVQAALEALPSVGAGGVTVTGSTGGLTLLFGPTAIAALTVDSGGLTGGDHPYVSLKQTCAGGITIGPTAFPLTGTTTVNLTCGTWDITVSAPLFITQTQTITFPGNPFAPAFQLVPEDGYTLIPPSNTPVVPPQTATLTGDPLGAGALQLISCTSGDCTYEVALAPQTLTWNFAANSCGSTGPAYTVTASRYIYYKAFYPCGSTDGSLQIMWAIIGDPTPPEYPPPYLPPDDPRNTWYCYGAGGTVVTCSLCQMGATGFFYGAGTSSSSLVECGTTQGGLLQLMGSDNPPAVGTAAGCMGASAQLPGWFGTLAAYQWAAIIGSVQADPCSPVLVGSLVVPCVTVSR